MASLLSECTIMLTPGTQDWREQKMPRALPRRKWVTVTVEEQNQRWKRKEEEEEEVRKVDSREGTSRSWNQSRDSAQVGGRECGGRRGDWEEVSKEEEEVTLKKMRADKSKPNECKMYWSTCCHRRR